MSNWDRPSRAGAPRGRSGSIVTIAGALLGVYGVVLTAMWIPGLAEAVRAFSGPGMSLAGFVGLLFLTPMFAFAAVEAILGYRAFTGESGSGALLLGGLLAIGYGVLLWQLFVDARGWPMIPMSVAAGIVSLVSGLIAQLRPA